MACSHGMLDGGGPLQGDEIEGEREGDEQHEDADPPPTQCRQSSDSVRARAWAPVTRMMFNANASLPGRR